MNKLATCFFVLLPLSLAGCSHVKPVAIPAKAAPSAVSTIAPTFVTADPPGALRYWKSGSTFISSLAFSPDSTRLATLTVSGLINGWNPNTGKLIYSYNSGLSSYISGITYSPDGHWLAASGTGNVICLLDAHNGSLSRSLKTKSDDVNTLQFSRDSKYLMVAGTAVMMWNTATWQKEFSIKTTDSTIFMSDGRRFIRCSQDGRICICDAQTGKVIQTWREPRKANALYFLCAISHDNKTLAVQSSEVRHIIKGQGDTQFEVISIRLLNARTGQLLRVLNGDKVNGQAAFSPRGGILANWDFDGYGPDQLAFWNIRTGHYKQVYDEGVMSAAFSPDGKILAMGDTDGGVILWHVPRV